MRILAGLAAFTIFLSVPVLAQSPSSSGYELNEVFIGPGGTRDSSSTNYDIDATLGDIGTGESASANFNLLAGFTTDSDPSIALAVNTAEVNLGVVDEETTGTGTASFSVASYNAEGYVVQMAGTSPTSENNINIPGLATPTASSAGTEQFGVNLVANTDPATFGANPVQVPDSTFSYGQVSTDYDTADVYKYVEGDQIAESSSSTGQTDYTISYILNVEEFTGAGTYVMEQTIIATSTF